MTLSETCPKLWCKVSKSRYLIVILTGLGTLYLRIQVLIIWTLLQRLTVADRTASPDLLQKVKLLLSPFTLSPDWRICLVERRYICMLET